MVRDTGPGLDLSSVDRLFDPFYTTKAAGMGMGLSISRSIIEAHLGTVGERQRGPGCHVSVPAHPDSAS